MYSGKLGSTLRHTWGCSGEPNEVYQMEANEVYQMEPNEVSQVIIPNGVPEAKYTKWSPRRLKQGQNGAKRSIPSIPNGAPKRSQTKYTKWSQTKYTKWSQTKYTKWSQTKYTKWSHQVYQVRGIKSALSHTNFWQYLVVHLVGT